MIDFIITVAAFAGGFWCGKTYGSLDAMGKRIKKLWSDDEPKS